jgi:hypothetical protein
MGWICGALRISLKRTFYLTLAMPSGLGQGANGNPFQRQWLGKE